MDISLPKPDIEQSILKSLENSNLIFNNTENVIYFFDYKTKKYDYMNSAILDLTGYSMDELNETGFQYIVKEILESRINEEGSSSPESIIEDFTGKYIIQTKNGELKWIEDISFARLNNLGRKDHSIGILRNVTPLHRMFNQLKEDKNKLDTILDIAEIIFMVFDKNFKIVFINRKGCDFFRCSREEILKINWIEQFVPEGYQSEFEKILTSIFAGEIKQYERHEHEIITPSGESKFISWHNSVLKDEDGQVINVIASGLDVTEKKKDELLQQIISEILNAANSEKNLEELFRFIHSEVSRLMPADNFYISLHEKENNTITFPYYIDEVDKEAPAKPFGKGLTEYVINTGKSALVTSELDRQLVESGEIELIGAPAAIWLGVPLKIQHNTIGVLVVQDYNNQNTFGLKEQEFLEVISYPISRAIERKVVEQERDELITRLKELNDSKDRLFSLISHDLRSPFNSLLGFSEILTTEFDSLTQDEIKEYLNVIYESSKNLYSMTNNLLQFSRFQMGRFEFTPVKLNIKKQIMHNINLLKGSIIKKQLNLNVDADINVDVLADEDMLNSIIQNLITNAIKFTHRGGDIRIFGRVLTFFNEPSQVEITVEDSGVGIHKEDLDKIFKDHMHSSPGTDKEYGTGLGLLLVKEFIQINGGNIKIKSKIGKGTSFTFTLPVMG